MVVVLGSPSGPDLVSFTYDTRVPRATVRRDLARLAKLTGWDLRGAEVEDRTSYGGGKGRMTTVDFVAPLAAPKLAGIFDLNPFLQTFKGYRRLGILYMMPPGFRYSGAKSYEDDYLRIGVDENRGSFHFHVLVKKPGFTRFEMPPAPPQAPAESSTAVPEGAAGGPVWWKAAAILMVLAGAGFLVYATLDWHSRAAKSRPTANGPEAYP